MTCNEDTYRNNQEYMALVQAFRNQTAPLTNYVARHHLGQPLTVLGKNGVTYSVKMWVLRILVKENEADDEDKLFQILQHLVNLHNSNPVVLESRYPSGNMITIDRSDFMDKTEAVVVSNFTGVPKAKTLMETMNPNIQNQYGSDFARNNMDLMFRYFAKYSLDAPFARLFGAPKCFWTHTAWAVANMKVEPGA
jgi:hypothetical protein